MVSETVAVVNMAVVMPADVESPGISVFPAKHEVLQLMMNSVQGWNIPACRYLVAFCFFLTSRKILEKMLPIYLFNWEFD